MTGPEPSYQDTTYGYSVFEHPEPFQCTITDNPNNGILPKFKSAFQSFLFETVQDRLRDVGRAVSEPRQRHSAPHRHVRLLPRQKPRGDLKMIDVLFISGQRGSGLVGAVYRAWSGHRHITVLRHLHQRPWLLLWLHVCSYCF